MIVWLFNDKQVRAARPAPKGLFWAATGNNRAWAYLALCAALSTPVYLTINWIFTAGATGLAIGMILNQTLNFHHSIVDAVIWRSPRRPVGTTA
jgi:hypothetical protein